MAKITAIIMVMIGLVIGANLIEPVSDGVNTAVVSTGVSAAVGSLGLILPLLFVVMLMIFAVKAVGDVD